MWKQETLETLRSASKPEQLSLFVANEPWCFLIIYKPFKRTWWEDQGSQSKCFYLEQGQKTLKGFVKWGNNELLPTTEQELSKTAGVSRESPRCLDPESIIFWFTILLEGTSQAETPGNITREAPDPLSLWRFYQETAGFLSAGKAHKVPKDSWVSLLQFPCFQP